MLGRDERGSGVCVCGEWWACGYADGGVAGDGKGEAVCLAMVQIRDEWAGEQKLHCLIIFAGVGGSRGWLLRLY